MYPSLDMGNVPINFDGSTAREKEKLLICKRATHSDCLIINARHQTKSGKKYFSVQIVTVPFI